MLLLGIFTDTEGKKQENLYYNWREWHKDTFSPSIKIDTMILFKVSGKTYREKQDNLAQLAKNFQCYSQGGLSYGELLEIYVFFEKNAKRYGLLKEFKGNGIL